MTSAPNDLINQARSESCDAYKSGKDDMDSSQEEQQTRSQPVDFKFFPANKRPCTSAISPSERPTNLVDDLNNNNNNNNDSNNSNNTGASVLEVIDSQSLRYIADEDYKMISTPRGVCLIINNVNFETETLPKRRGSDKDAFRLREIFKQCGFEVLCKKDVTADRMKLIFTQTAALTNRRHDALVVFLLSHGNETAIYGSDGIEVDLNDMLTHFDNTNCKQMMGKPKFFAVQACRGRLADYGARDRMTFLSQVDTQDDKQLSQESQLIHSTTRSNRWAEMDREHQPTRTDMMLCFSCHSGYGSIRNEDEGSWFVESFARYFPKFAHERHLVEILNMVSREVRLRRSEDGHKQVLEITTIGFDRNMYFNPGLPKPAAAGEK